MKRGHGAVVNARHKWRSAGFAMLVTAVTLFVSPPAHAANWDTLYDFAGGGGAQGWFGYESRPGFYTNVLTAPVGGPAPGLWTSPTGSTDGSKQYTLSPATNGGWGIAAPGAGAVVAADLGRLRHRDHHDHQMVRWSLANSIAFGSEVAYGEYFSTADLDTNPAPIGYGPGAPLFTLGLIATACTPGSPFDRQGCPPELLPPPSDPSEYAHNRLDQVVLTFSDPETPSAGVSGPLTTLMGGGWNNVTGVYPVTVSASDQTSGVEYLELEDQHGENLLASNAPCDANHTNPALGARECPTAYGDMFAFDTTNIPDGMTEVSITAYDFSGELNEYVGHVRIDRTPPPQVPAVAWREVSGGARLMWNPATDATSGIDRYEWQASNDGGSTTCANGSTLFNAWTTPVVGAPCFTGNGVRIQFRVRAVDLANNAGVWSSWHGEYVGPPTINLNRLVDDTPSPLAAGQWLRAAVKLDTPAADQGAGVDRVEYVVDGASVTSCPNDPATPYRCTFNSATFPDGNHTIGAKAIDLAEGTPHETLAAQTVSFDNTPPAAPQQPSVQRVEDNVKLSWQPSDPGAGSPIDRYEYRYATPSDQLSDWSSTPSVEAAVPAAAIEFASDPVFQVRAYDVAGNVSGQTPMSRDPFDSPPPEPSSNFIIGGGTLPALTPEEVAAASVLAVNKPTPASRCHRDSDKPYVFGAIGDFTSIATLDHTSPPPCRYTTERSRSEPKKRHIDDPARYEHTNARANHEGLNRTYRKKITFDGKKKRAWPLYDSFGVVRLWVTNGPAGVGKVEWRFWQAASNTSAGPRLGSRIVPENADPIRIQGRACMASPTYENNTYAIQFPAVTSVHGTTEIGKPSIWGFVSRKAIGKVSSKKRRAIDEAAKYDAVLRSCGRTHPLKADPFGSAFALSRDPFRIPLHHYLGATSWSDRCKGNPAECGSYAFYQMPPGADLRVVASSTTGAARGGLPLAFVHLGTPFQPIRIANYCDPNVVHGEVPSTEAERTPYFYNATTKRYSRPKMRGRWHESGHAFWVFGRFTRAGKHIYAWAAERCERLNEIRGMLK